MDTSLDQFPRAVAIAEQYQHYRIRNIKLRIKSPYDTYINMGPTGTGAYQKPYLYYMIDKSGTLSTSVTLENLKGMGARPRAMDEKSITVSWAPSVLTTTATSLAPTVQLPNQYKISPWLSTTDDVQSATFVPSSVSHLGIYWGAFAALAGTEDPITYDVEVEVQFQFKKPNVTVLPGAPAATPAVFAQQNASVDGIVGGPDGI